MKIIITICLIFFNLISCQTKENNNEIKNIKENNVNNIKMKEQPIYTLAISVANPHEVYLNDIPLIKDYNKGSSNFEMPMNNFILKSGLQSLRIVLLPEKGKTMVDKLGIDHVEVKIYRYSNGLSEMNPENRILVKTINLKEFKEMTQVVKEVEFDARVPYEVKGWSESVDLSKENQNELEKEVLSKYEELRKILNDGNYEKFAIENKKNDSEVLKSLFENSEAQKEDEEFSKERIGKSKNNMVDLKDFHFVFYGNNRLITLENSDGESPLYGDDGEMIYTYFILLHRPKQGMALEIIR